MTETGEQISVESTWQKLRAQLNLLAYIWSHSDLNIWKTVKIEMKAKLNVIYATWR